MARTLDDVLHHFVPELERAPAEPVESADPPARAAVARRGRGKVVAIPLGERDVVRASLAWNLAIEVARLGAGVTLLSPADADSSMLWPEPGAGPLGSELALSFAHELPELLRSAFELAESRSAARANGVELVMVRVPPTWLGKSLDGSRGFDRVLLLSSPDRRDLLESYALAKRIVATSPTTCLGLTLHGARSVADAERAFLRFAAACERHLVRAVVSYGLVVDDLHVYRSIVSRRPVGLVHPKSPASRSLADVARLLLRDLADESHG
jgi:hypothetical protein